MTFQFIADHAAEQPVRWMCEALEVSAAGYYAWATREDSPTQKWRCELLGAIEEVHAEVRQRYGSPRMHAELTARDYECSENTVAKLMRVHAIRAKTPRRFARTTDSNHKLPVAENVLGRDFAPAGPNVSWCADITDVPTREGWLYLAVGREMFATRDQARAEIFEYLEVFYNRVRRHSWLGYVSPVEFERTYNRDHR